MVQFSRWPSDGSWHRSIRWVLAPAINTLAESSCCLVAHLHPPDRNLRPERCCCQKATIRTTSTIFPGRLTHVIPVSSMFHILEGSYSFCSRSSLYMPYNIATWGLLKPKVRATFVAIRFFFCTREFEG